MVAKLEIRTAEVRKRFLKISRNVQKAVNPAVIKSANELAALQRTIAPVDSGALRDSIKVTGPGERTPEDLHPDGSQVVPDAAAVVSAGDEKAYYAHMVEYGTARTQGRNARPFFWPAYRLLKKRMTRRIKSAITKAIKAEKGL